MHGLPIAILATANNSAHLKHGSFLPALALVTLQTDNENASIEFENCLIFWEKLILASFIFMFVSHNFLFSMVPYWMSAEEVTAV